MQPLIARLCSPTIKSQPTPHPLPPPSWNKKSVDTDCLQEHDCVLRQKAVLLLQQVFVSEAKQRKRQGNFLRNVLLPYQAKLNGFSCLKNIIILFLRRSCNVLQCSGLKVTLGSEIGMRRGEMCACMCVHLLYALVTVAVWQKQHTFVIDYVVISTLLDDLPWHFGSYIHVCWRFMLCWWTQLKTLLYS